MLALTDNDPFVEFLQSVLKPKRIPLKVDHIGRSNLRMLFDPNDDVDLIGVDYERLVHMDVELARDAFQFFAVNRTSKLSVCDEPTVERVRMSLAYGGTIQPTEWDKINHTTLFNALRLEEITHRWSEAHSDDHPRLLPRTMYLRLRQLEQLRYGENPQQSGALYSSDWESPPLICSANKVQGKQLSYNNISDADAAYSLVAEFDPSDVAAVAIIKHANPSGVAQSGSLVSAYRKALNCDKESAFGGVVALNRTLDAETAREISKIFTEVIVAPDATRGARAILSKKKNLRLVLPRVLPKQLSEDFQIRSINRGYLIQTNDVAPMNRNGWQVKTKRIPTDQQWADLEFAWRVAKHVKSNAIVFAKNGATVGIGAGQMSRVDSADIGARKGGAHINGSVMASDAFLPFPDALEVAARAGAKALIQPGGSVRDAEVIEAADKAEMAMLFTDTRHFRH